MHTQQQQTPARPIYWTTGAEEEWFKQRQYRLSRDARRPSSRADVEEYARELGAQCVNRAVVMAYFGEATE